MSSNKKKKLTTKAVRFLTGFVVGFGVGIGVGISFMNSSSEMLCLPEEKERPSGPPKLKLVK